MRSITHIFFALLISKLLELNPIIVIIFSLLPDIDQPKSIIGTIFRPISNFINKLFGHRNFTHSLLFSLFFIFYSPAFIGILSHLLLDLLNYSGIQIFYPHKKKYRIAKIKVGSNIEYLLLMGFIILYLVL